MTQNASHTQRCRGTNSTWGHSKRARTKNVGLPNLAISLALLLGSSSLRPTRPQQWRLVLHTPAVASTYSTVSAEEDRDGAINTIILPGEGPRSSVRCMTECAEERVHPPHLLLCECAGAPNVGEVSKSRGRRVLFPGQE